MPQHDVPRPASGAPGGSPDTGTAPSTGSAPGIADGGARYDHLRATPAAPFGDVFSSTPTPLPEGAYGVDKEFLEPLPPGSGVGNRVGAAYGRGLQRANGQDYAPGQIERLERIAARHWNMPVGGGAPGGMSPGPNLSTTSARPKAAPTAVRGTDLDPDPLDYNAVMTNPSPELMGTSAITVPTPAPEETAAPEGPPTAPSSAPVPPAPAEAAVPESAPAAPVTVPGATPTPLRPAHPAPEPAPVTIPPPPASGTQSAAPRVTPTPSPVGGVTIPEIPPPSTLNIGTPPTLPPGPSVKARKLSESTSFIDQPNPSLEEINRLVSGMPGLSDLRALVDINNATRQWWTENLAA